jgi:hypothetical protein
MLMSIKRDVLHMLRLLSYPGWPFLYEGTTGTIGGAAFRVPREPHAARLLWDKLEADSDFHVVIAGQSGATMVAEVADPGCAAGSRVGTTLTRVRQEYARGPPAQQDGPRSRLNRIHAQGSKANVQ